MTTTTGRRDRRSIENGHVERHIPADARPLLAPPARHRKTQARIAFTNCAGSTPVSLASSP
jgi:hypothetical protein